MRSTFLFLWVSMAVLGCSGVDDAPLGGPNGGTTDLTDPNGGSPAPGTDDGGAPDASPPTSDAGGSDASQPKDSGGPQQDSGPPSAPTWTAIFNSYMKSGTKGRCSSCHSQGSSASALYSWLQGRGYIGGKNSPLVDSSQSCLSWYGGNMPPSGPTSYGNAVSDMNAWAAAGAQNN